MLSMAMHYDAATIKLDQLFYKNTSKPELPGGGKDLDDVHDSEPDPGAETGQVETESVFD